MTEDELYAILAQPDWTIFGVKPEHSWSLPKAEIQQVNLPSQIFVSAESIEQKWLSDTSRELNFLNADEVAL